MLGYSQQNLLQLQKEWMSCSSGINFINSIGYTTGTRVCQGFHDLLLGPEGGFGKDGLHFRRHIWPFLAMTYFLPSIVIHPLWGTQEARRNIEEFFFLQPAYLVKFV